MRHVTTVLRLLFGLAFFVFGTNGLFHFLPEPKPELPENVMRFVVALAESGYMMELIAVTQAVVGALLLANRFVPLALALITPFLVNSLAFHVFLERSGLPMALVFCAILAWLAWAYRDSYRTMLAARAAPAR